MVLILFVVLYAAAFWKLFEKAGRPGWEALIPIYNFYILCKIAQIKNWWLVFLPLINIYILIITPFKVATAFGKETGFGFGLLFLGFIFYPILGFGSATYQYGVSELQEDINAIGA